MANEFFAEGGSDIATTMTPGDAGVLRVIADGDTIFDKADEGSHPNLDRVKIMRTAIREKLDAAAG